MRKVPGDLKNVHVYAHEAIVLTSPSVEEHYQLLHAGFDRLHTAGLNVASGKCRLIPMTLKYLGH